MFQDILAYSVYFDYKRFPLGLKDLLYSSCGGPAVAGMQGFTSLTEYVYFPAIVCLSPYTEYACPTIQSLCVTPYKVCCPLHSMIDPLHRMFVPLHIMIVPLHSNSLLFSYSYDDNNDNMKMKKTYKKRKRYLKTINMLNKY